MLLHVSEEVEFRLSRANQKNLAAILERPGDVVEISVVIVWVVPDAHVDLVCVTVDVRAGCIDDRLRDLVGVDLEDPTLFVIDP